MNRIAITGSFRHERTLLANALSCMTGFDIMISPTYSLTSHKYNLSSDISKCQWPDSYVYCLDAFTQRVIVEQKYGDRLISDGSVLQELSWIKCRYPQNELIYEQAMVNSLEKVIVEYMSNSYDRIFYINTSKSPDTIDQYLLKIYAQYSFNFIKIDGSDKKNALNQMVDNLRLRTILSADYSLMKASGNLSIDDLVFYENSN